MPKAPLETDEFPAVDPLVFIVLHTVQKFITRWRHDVVYMDPSGSQTYKHISN